VVDAGCGHGVATLLMARRWPRSTFVGIDLHEPSILAARANAVEAGSPPNVSFRAGTAEHMDVGAADVVMFFDALHDMGDPPAVLRRSRELLTAEGTVVVVEPWSLDHLEDGIGNPSVRLDDAISTSLCTPASQAQPGAYALGTQGGPARRLALLADAGFRNPTVVADTGVNLVLAAST
jgi:SAM-dependent methyltransferase